MNQNTSGVVRFSAYVDEEEHEHARTPLKELTIRSNEGTPVTPYYRQQLSLSWVNMNGVGLDMKDFIFSRHATNPVYLGNGFIRERGTILEDPYSGKTLRFHLEEKPADWRIDLDHIVSLADAYRSGAYRWSPSGSSWKRLYKHPGNLLPTDRAINRAKGDKARRSMAARQPAV